VNEHAEEPQDCSDVLEALYLFIDGEIDSANAGLIRHHLEECAPCLKAYDLDVVVKTLVARSCTEHAPPPLRERVLMSIRQVQVHLSVEEQRPPR
jgi:mycothiol system anti-sigma-R factor